MVNTTAIENCQNEASSTRRGLQPAVVNQPTMTTDGDLANTVNVPKQDIQNLRLDLTAIGSLRAERKQGRSHNAVWQTEWMLLDTKDVAGNKLTRRWAKDDRTTQERMQAMGESNSKRFTGRHRIGGEGQNGMGAKLLPRGITPSSVSTNGVHDLGTATPAHPVVPDVLVASAGPQAASTLKLELAPARFDESRGLVEAARSYAGVHNQVTEKLKELEKLGVRVDYDKIAKGMSLPQDSQLAAVSRAMPYITQIERENERLKTQVEDQRQKLADLPTITQERNRLREANQRLVAEKTDLLNRLAARASERPPQSHRPDHRSARRQPRRTGPGRPAISRPDLTTRKRAVPCRDREGRRPARGRAGWQPLSRRSTPSPTGTRLPREAPSQSRSRAGPTFPGGTGPLPIGSAGCGLRIHRPARATSRRRYEQLASDLYVAVVARHDWWDDLRPTADAGWSGCRRHQSDPVGGSRRDGRLPGRHARVEDAREAGHPPDDHLARRRAERDHDRDRGGPVKTKAKPPFDIREATDCHCTMRLVAPNGGRCDCTEARVHAAELTAYFNLRWEADMRAIKRWQAAHPGNELTWPDHADMVVWLLEQL
jgi:hypothetical protein